MNRGGTIILAIVTTLVLSAGMFWITGLPLHSVPAPTSGIVGAISDTASDPRGKSFLRKPDDVSCPSKFFIQLQRRDTLSPMCPMPNPSSRLLSTIKEG